MPTPKNRLINANLTSKPTAFLFDINRYTDLILEFLRALALTTQANHITSTMSLQDIFGLQNKVAFVTGAGSGLGAEMAEALAIAGADIVLVGRNVPKLEVVAQRIHSLGRKSLVCQLDVAQEDKVEEAIQIAVAHFGRIGSSNRSHLYECTLNLISLDILINNAGAIENPTLLHDMSTEEWRRILAVDLDGVFYLSRAVLKVMLKQGNGKIINIGIVIT